MTYSNGSIKWIFGTSSCLKWKNFSTASLGLDFSVSLRLSLGCNITQRLWNTGLGPAFFRYLFRSQTSPNSQCINTLNSLNDPLNWLCSFSPDHPLYGFFYLMIPWIIFIYWWLSADGKMLFNLVVLFVYRILPSCCLLKVIRIIGLVYLLIWTLFSWGYWCINWVKQQHLILWFGAGLRVPQKNWPFTSTFHNFRHIKTFWISSCHPAKI